MTTANTLATLGNGPAFSAYMSANFLMTTANTNYKLPFNTKVFDTNTNFDATTNYRFTPTVSGYYQINLTTYTGSNPTPVYFASAIYKNGSQYASGSGAINTTSALTLAIPALIYFNGSTDYVEAYVTAGGNGYTVNGTSIVFSTFSGCLLKGA